MWMMGCNDAADQLNLPDSLISGRKLRPLIPRPSTTTANGTDLLSFNNLLGSGAEQSKRELNTQPVVVSSRWNPTPEQLQILEELYRRGTRTPSTDHIQHITAQLRRYGKIEGKNVFYWFQNHKARERQKRRRQLESPNSDEHFHDLQENIERKELSGANRTGIEVEQTKNWAPTANSSSTFAEMRKGSGSLTQRGEGAERRKENIRWKQIEEGESTMMMMNQRTRSSVSERNATWQKMQYLSCSSTVIPPSTTNNLLINSTITTTTTVPTRVVKTTTMDPKLIKPQDLSTIFLGSQNHQNHLNQTLELFPLRSGGSGDCTVNENGSIKETGTTTDAINGGNLSSAPCQFFEFLPLKN